MTSSQIKKVQETLYAVFFPIETKSIHKKGQEDHFNNSLGDDHDDYPGAGAILSELYAKDDNTAYHIPHRGEISDNFIPVTLDEMAQVNISYTPPTMLPTPTLPVVNEVQTPILIIHIVGGHDSYGFNNPGFVDNFHWE